MGEVQSSREKRAFRRKKGRLCPFGVQSPNWKWLRLLGLITYEFARRKHSLGQNGGGRGTGFEPSPRRPTYSSELWRRWCLAKTVAKAALFSHGPPARPRYLRPALNFRHLPQSLVGPFRANRRHR